MKRTRMWSGALLAGVLSLSLAPPAGWGGERPGFETYVVRHGDTLSGIAGRVFGDPKRWREIQKENPQVTNPNRIYPGDSLLVPVPLSAAPAGLEAKEADDLAAKAAAEAEAAAKAATEAEAAAKAAAEAEAAARAAANAVPELPLETVRRPATVSAATYRNAGYISEGLPSLALISVVDDRLLLGTGDVAVASVPVPPGRRFTVVRAERRVFHPVSGRSLGWLMRVLGEAECTCRGEQTATVAMRSMRDAAGVGDYLIPVDPADVLEENAIPGKAVSECVASGPAEGVVVAFDEERGAGAEQQYAYIVPGAVAGSSPGKRFVIYRRIQPEGQMMIGELQVLRAGAETSTALITTSMREVQVGDLLRAR